MKVPDWGKFEEYIVQRLKEIDPYCRRTPGSGNKGRKGDVLTNCGLHIECKQTKNKSSKIDNEVWKKLCGEIPLHSKNIPVYALENGEKKKWVVLDLDEFLNLYIDYWRMKNGE